MGSTHNKLHHCLAISFLFLLISSFTHLRLIAEGRAISRQVGHYQKSIMPEEKTILRGQIGSKPPQCERRCSSCGHCEAIQVPTNPQIKTGTGSKSSSSSIDYARGGDDDSSNYKPMSWKCKCGNSLFNP